MKKLLLSFLVAGSVFAHAGFMNDLFVGGVASLSLDEMPEDILKELSYGIEGGGNLYNGDDYVGFLSLGVRMPMPEPYLILKYGYEFMRNNPLSFGLDVSYGIGWLSDKWYSVNSGGVFGKWNLDNFAVILRTGVFGAKESIGFNTDVNPYVSLGLQYNL